MIEGPNIISTDAVVAAVIHVVTPREKIQQVMGPAIAEVMAAVIAQAIGPAGPVFAHYLSLERGTFDFEVGVPVMSPVSPIGRVQATTLPAMRVARTVCRGPYDELHNAWREFDAWVKAEGHTPAPDLVERYVSGPESSADPADWRTELIRPLV